jgi:hypothetical protein
MPVVLARLGVGAVVCMAGVVLLGTVGLVVVVAGAGALTSPAGGSGPPGPAIAPAMLMLYRQASTTCPGLPFAVLAAVGTVESSNGTSSLPGVRAGANPAGAEGPMQFLPATFAEYAQPVPPGGAVPSSPYDPVDAVYAATRLLCANGAAGGADLPGALFAYNHSPVYVAEVLRVANQVVAAYGP